VRGASALEQILDESTGRRLRVLVVWMPVLLTDLGPPRSSTMALVGDARVRQFWDPKRLVSARFLDAARAHPDWMSERDRYALSRDKGVVWDFVALFPSGATWKAEPPRPAYHGGPVVDVADPLRQALSAVK